MPSDGPALSWSHTFEDSRTLRALVALPVGVVGSVTLAVVVAVVWLVATTFVAGNYFVGVVLLLAAGFTLARVAMLHAPPGAAGALAGENGWRFDWQRVGWRWVAGGAAVGLAVLAVGAQFGPVGVAAAFVGTVLVPPIIASVLSSEGEIRTGETLTYCGTDVDLRTLAGFRRRAAGGYVAYRLSYVAGTATFGTPRLIVVPRAVDDKIREALDAGVAADFDDRADARSSNRTVRIAAVAFGLFFLAFGGVLLTVEPNSPNPRAGGILVYAALTSGGLGLLFLLVAARQ